VLLGADYYEPQATGHAAPHRVPIGIGADVELDRVIVDKNARIGDGVRLINTSGVQEADGEGYYIRNGIIIVPKDATIPPGLTV
jgi:glucose-1-phosphate adenylyltransferase